MGGECPGCLAAGPGCLLCGQQMKESQPEAARGARLERMFDHNPALINCGKFSECRIQGTSRPHTLAWEKKERFCGLTLPRDCQCAQGHVVSSTSS